jgi:hypothetical protein
MDFVSILIYNRYINYLLTLLEFIMDLFPTPTTLLIESTTRLTDTVTNAVNTVPVVSNVAILSDSTFTACRAAVNFYCSPNPISKVCFAASCLFGVAGAASSGTALVTSFMGVPLTGLVGSFGARGFNRLGKYTLHMGNVTNGNITNATEIADLMN